MFYGYVLLGLSLASVSVSAGKDRYNDGFYKANETTECKDLKIEDVYNQGRVRVWKADESRSCSTSVTLKAKDKSSRLLVRVADIDCSRIGSLEFKGLSEPVAWFCDSVDDLPTVWSTSNYLKITYNSGLNNLNSDKPIKLELYYNELLEGPCGRHYHDDDDNTDDTDDDDDDDDDDEFQCSTRQDGRTMCIDDVLKCDGFNNCGDGSDEHSSVCGLPTTTIGSSGTNASTGVPKGIIAVAVICALLGLLLIICVVGLCVLSKNKNNSQVKKCSKNAVGPNVIASAPKKDTAIYHIKAEGDFPTLSPPPYLVGGSRYANTVVAPGALDAERGASAPIYEDMKVPVNGVLPTQTSTNQ